MIFGVFGGDVVTTWRTVGYMGTWHRVCGRDGLTSQNAGNSVTLGK